MMKYADPGTTRRHLVSQRLLTRRRTLGLTQQQVVARVERLGMRTTNRALSGLERGAGLDSAKLPELAHALDCSVTYLLGLTDDPGRWQPDHDLAFGRSSADRHAPVDTASTATGAGRARPWILGPDVPDLSNHNAGA